MNKNLSLSALGPDIQSPAVHTWTVVYASIGTSEIKLIICFGI